MGVFAGPDINESGLVLALDAGNIFKNTSSSTTTNFLKNGSFSGGTGVLYESGSNPTNTILELQNPGDSNFVLRQNGNNAEYHMNIDGGAQGTLSANTQYVMSGWYAKSSDYNGVDTMFHARAHSSSGAHIFTGTGVGTLLYSTIVGGLTWEFRYQTISTPADYNGDFDWYLGYGTNNTTGFRYYTNLRFEQGSFPSLIDLSRNGNDSNIINSPTYSSANGGSFGFNGSNTHIIIPNSTALDTQTPTVEVWVKTNATTQNGFWFEKGEVNTQYSLFQEGSVIQWRMNIGGSINNLSTTTATYMNTSSWYQVVGTYTSGTRRLYINGVLVNSDTQSGTISTNNGGMSIGAFGGFTASTGRAYYYNGNLAICRVYNRALTAAEVQQSFNANRGRFGI